MLDSRAQWWFRLGGFNHHVSGLTKSGFSFDVQHILLWCFTNSCALCGACLSASFFVGLSSAHSTAGLPPPVHQLHVLAPLAGLTWVSPNFLLSQYIAAAFLVMPGMNEVRRPDYCRRQREGEEKSPSGDRYCRGPRHSEAQRRRRPPADACLGAAVCLVCAAIEVTHPAALWPVES